MAAPPSSKPSTWSSVAPTTNGSGEIGVVGAPDEAPATTRAARAAMISRDLRTATLSSLGTTSPLSQPDPLFGMGRVDHLYRSSVLIGKQCVREPLRPEAHRVARGKTRLVLG